MKKISFFFILSSFFFLFSPVSALWYGNTWEAKNINGGVTNCSLDGDTTGGSPSFFNPLNSTYYYYDSQQIGQFGVNMLCQKWDGSVPTGTINYYNGWTNSTTHMINFTYSDAGGSGFSQYTVQYRSANDSPAFNNWSGWNNLPGCVNRNTGSSCIAGSLSNGNAYQYRIVLFDIAGNSNTINSSDTIQIDTVPPTPGDITISPGDSTNHLATNNQALSVNVSNAGGSPISRITTYFTDYSSNTNAWLPTPFVSPSGSQNISASIQNVDLLRSANGSRQYSLYVYEACDSANNCLYNTFPSSFPTSYFARYFVYPNTNLLSGGVTQNLDLSTNVANGLNRGMNISLEDIYGNDIIPASGIGRTIDFSIASDNTLYLDQYRRSGPSGVYVSSPNQILNNSSNPATINIATATNTTSFLNQNPLLNTNTYPFYWKIWTPTSNSLPNPNTITPNSSFSINGVYVDFNGTLGQRSNVPLALSSGAYPINARFKPLFTTSISGELETEDFYEGRIQTSNIGFQRDGSLPTNISQLELRLEFGSGSRQTASGLSLRYDQSTPPTSIMTNGRPSSSDINQLSIFASSLSNPNLGSNVSENYNLSTKLVRLGGNMLSQIKLYLSSHISYIAQITDSLGQSQNIRVTYNGYVLNKSNYFDDVVNSDGATQQGAKVTGIATSKITTQINPNQAQDIQVLGNLDKSTLKKDIISKVYKTIKTIKIIKNDGTSTNGSKQITNISQFELNSDGAKANKNSILYFGNFSQSEITNKTNFVELTSGLVIPSSTPDTTSPKEVRGRKTIVIVGGDLLISENMYYDTTNDSGNTPANTKDMLGIIVLKDKNGKGGNIYIHPRVTNIVGTIIADGSIFSGRKNSATPQILEIIDDSIVNSQDILRNQLHIYGSLMSENTLGGSRKTDVNGNLLPSCPFFVKKADCSLEVAERYDLNFIRRFNLSTKGANRGLPYGTDPTNQDNANNPKISGGGMCRLQLLPTRQVLCNSPHASKLRRTLTDITNAEDPLITPTSDSRSYGRYSVILEYNPSISSVQAPLFEK